MDFDELMDIVLAINSAKKFGWNFIQVPIDEDGLNGLKLLAKHQEKGLIISIENKQDLSYFCTIGRFEA